MPISSKKLNAFTKKVSDLPDKPSQSGISAADVKAQMDAAPEELRVAYNGLIDALGLTTDGDSGADNIGATQLNAQSGATVQALFEYIFAQMQGMSQGAVADDTVTEPKLSPDVRAKLNKTATQLLTDLLTVDGTGSGLDADMLEGRHGSEYTGFESVRFQRVGSVSFGTGSPAHMAVQGNGVFVLSGNRELVRVDKNTGSMTTLASATTAWGTPHRLVSHPTNTDELWGVFFPGGADLTFRIAKYTISSNAWTLMRTTGNMIAGSSSLFIADMVFTKDGQKAIVVGHYALTSTGYMSAEVFNYTDMSTPASTIYNNSLGAGNYASGCVVRDETNNVWKVLLNKSATFDVVFNITDAAAISGSSFVANLPTNNVANYCNVLIDPTNGNIVYNLRDDSTIPIKSVYRTNGGLGANVDSFFQTKTSPTETSNTSRTVCFHGGYLYQVMANQVYKIKVG